MRKHRIVITFILVINLLLSSCQVFDHPAERVVNDMYNAISESDIDAYMDAIHPENRKQPNIFGLLSAFSIALGPVRADLGKLTHISVRDVKVSLVREYSDSYVIVQAEGYLRYPILMLEFKFCDQHDVRRYSDGNWYVDLYATERVERLNRILFQYQAELSDPYHEPSYSNESLYAAIFEGIEKGLDLCLDELP